MSDNQITLEGQGQIQTANPFSMQQNAGGALARIASNAEVVREMASIHIAKQFPRNVADVTRKMLESCSRYSLAEQATYSYRRGKSVVEGVSIRLAEALLGAYGNIEAGWKEIERYYDVERDCGVSVCVAFCFDKENNTQHRIAFHVPHTRDKNETVNGEKVMTREKLASERDIYELCANMASRRIRACILRVLPAWLVEEAMDRIRKTLEQGDSRPIADIIRSLEAKFLAKGVTRKDLEVYAGHKLEELTKKEIVELGKIYNAIDQGDQRVRDFFPGEDAPVVAEPKPGRKAEDVTKTDAANESKDAGKDGKDKVLL